MENAIMSGIIGGIFTLIGVYFKHRLETRLKTSSTTKSANQPSQKHSNTNVQVDRPTSGKDIKKGILLLVLDFIIIAAFVSIFDLRNNEPEWENLFAVIVIGVIPTYALFRIGRGIYKFISN